MVNKMPDDGLSCFRSSRIDYTSSSYLGWEQTFFLELSFDHKKYLLIIQKINQVDHAKTESEAIRRALDFFVCS
jgi:hypothetical protein